MWGELLWLCPRKADHLIGEVRHVHKKQGIYVRLGYLFVDLYIRLFCSKFLSHELGPEYSITKLYHKILKTWCQFLSLMSNPKNSATHLISTLVTYLDYQGNNNFIYSMEIQNL